MALAAASFCACAGLPPAPEPTGVDRGMLLARVVARGAVIRFWKSYAESGVAIMLDEAGQPVPGATVLSAEGPDGYVFFPDLPPGRYSLASGSWRARGARYYVKLPEDGLAKRVVVLKPGAAAFLGEYWLDAEWPEDGWSRLFKIVGRWVTPWRKRPMIPRQGFLRIQDWGREAESNAMRAASRALESPRWRKLAEARLRELGAPEPPKTQGLRNRPIPLKPETILSWRDTLEWGEPRRRKDALEWREPNGDARIAVFFTTRTTPGFAGFEQAELELRRAAAGSVEDSGDVYEVRVATRPGRAAVTTTHRYPEGTLTGSVVRVEKTETVIVADGYGMFTARLRAPAERFRALLPKFREFLLQLELGTPPPKPPPKAEPMLPGGL